MNLVQKNKISAVYIGNFLSSNLGINPTQSEILIPKLIHAGILIKYASMRTNRVLRLMDMAAKILFCGSNSSIFFDLYSGPNAFPAAVLLVSLCKIMKKKYVIVLHGGDLPSRLEKDREVFRRILRGAVKVVAPSNFLAEKFSHIASVEVIPNGIEKKNYHYRLRRNLKPKILFLRAFHRYYDPLTAIRAFSILSRKYNGALLTLAGPDERVDDTFTQCLKLTEELNLKHKIIFTGRVAKNKVPALMNDHDLFINSSVVDNTPVSTIEAMSSGMCIVATKTGGLPYLLEDKKTALFADAKNHNQLADAMRYFLEDAEMAARCSFNAAQEAEKMDWLNVIPRWIDLMEKVSAK